MSLGENSQSGASVIRAPYGMDFIEQDDDQEQGKAPKLRVNTMESPETHDISYDEGTTARQSVAVSQSIMNPMFSNKTMQDGSIGRRISITPRVVDDLKEEIQTMRDMLRQQEEQRDELLAVMAQERASNDARHAKTLGLLQKKDVVIDELSHQCDEASERIYDLELLLEEERRRRVDTENTMETLIKKEETLMQDLKDKDEEHRTIVAEYQNQIRGMEENITRKESELDAEKQARLDIESNMDDVAQAMDAAEEIMNDMEVRFEKEKRILENRCKNLELFIGEKLGIDVLKHVQYLPSLVQPEDTGDQNGEDHGDTKLVKANKALEDALIKHAIETKRIGVAIGNGVHDIAIPSFMKDREIEEDSVETLRLELEQVSKAHQLAQKVALHAESELMAALDRESELQQELQNREEGMNKQEEEQWREDALDKLVDLEDTCHQLEEALALKVEEIEKLHLDVREARDSKANAEEAWRIKEKDMNKTFVDLHDEIQSLRAELYTSRQNASCQEARVASLQAVQKFTMDLSELESLDFEQVDPSSEPIEFLVKSLQEATKMQTELLESLSKVSYLNEHGHEELQAMQLEVERLKKMLSKDEQDDQVPRVTLVNRIHSSQQEEIESLRSQLRRAVAIQQGQSEAFSEMAEKFRRREGELKASILDAKQALGHNDDFMSNLETAVAAIKSGMAKLALVEHGEDAANEILSSEVSPQSIFELSIVLSNKLTELAQAMSEEKLPTNTAAFNAKKLKHLEEKYNIIVSAYEAAKMEAKQATLALEQWKSSTHGGAPHASPHASISMATSGPILGDTSNILNLVNKFEEVLDESARQENKIQELELRKSQWAAASWNALVAKKLILSKTHEMSLKFRHDIQMLEEANTKHQKENEELKSELEVAHASLESAIRKHDLLKERFQEEMDQTKEIFQEQIRNLKKDLHDQDTLSADQIQDMIDNAAIQAEDQCAFEYQGKIDTMEEEITKLQTRCQELQAEKDKVEENFKRFQEVKNASIELLEQRLNIVGSHTTPKGQVKRKDALSRIEDACNSDAANAALQQAKFEKLTREKLEQEMQRMIQAHQQMTDENIPAKYQFKTALAEADARIEALDKRLLLENTGKADTERIKADWYSDARKVEDGIVQMTFNLGR